MRKVTRTIGCLLVTLAAATGAQSAPDRLLQGEALFESLLGNHLDALLVLNSGPSPRGAAGIADAQLALGLGGTVAKDIKTRPVDPEALQARNRDAYRLALYYYHRREPALAMKALDSIEGKAAGVSATDQDYLRALLYMEFGRFRDAAGLLYELPLAQRPGGYTQYNMGIAQIKSGNEERGRSTLAGLGRSGSGDAEVAALKDLANIKLAYRYLQEGSFEQARESFNRVRLDGPFTNQALLGSGWTLFAMGQTDRAIVSWSVLHKQEAINDTVIEAKMALPYAYSKLGAHGKAANLYAHAVELLESEIARLDAASEAVRKGELGRAIVDSTSAQGDDWFIALSRDSERPAFFLPLLLANEEFREQAGQLHRLALVAGRVERGHRSAAADIEYASLKQKHFKNALPAAEKELSAVYEAIKRIVPPAPETADAANTAAKPVAEIVLLKQTYDDFLETRKAAAEYSRRLPEYGRELAALSKALKRVDKKLDQAIAATGKQVEAKALAILDQKRGQLKGYHHNALFALAESYDFATGRKQ